MKLAGHLTALLPPEGEKVLLTVFTGLALVFAARKYTQAVKDDIGDKSVFTCALSLLLDRMRIVYKGFVVEKMPLSLCTRQFRLLHAGPHLKSTAQVSCPASSGAGAAHG